MPDPPEAGNPLFPPSSLPPGTYAWLPEDLERLRKDESIFRKIAAKAKYREVATPTLDFTDTFHSLGSSLAGRLFSLTDQTGQRLALRPEITTSIARLYATALAGRRHPVRIYYIGQVFRQARRFTGELREYRQAGVEVFGLASPKGDIEVLSLARKVLRGLGARRARIEVGHARIVKGLLLVVPIDASRKEKIQDAIHRKDPGDLRALAEGLPEKIRDSLAWLASMESGAPGGEAKFYEKAKRHLDISVRGAIDELRAVVTRTGDKDLTVDLGVARNLDYYTGVVFEAFLPDVPGAVLGGGRYDHLTESFGVASPAIGFSIEMERLVRAPARG